MNKLIFIALSCLMAIGCAPNKSTNKEKTEAYFNARSSFNYKAIQNLISDSLTVIEGDYVMHYSEDEFYEVFKWDSVFQTTYEIIDIRAIDEQIIASIALSSIRNKFLKNDLMTCDFKLSFQAGNISKIESLDCKDANWEAWQNRVNTLVSWIDANHPELNGFIHDMTMTGANNYVTAISLYQLKENGM